MKLKFLILLLLIMLTSVGCSAGSQEIGTYITFKGYAIVSGSDVLIDYNGRLIVAAGEASNYQQIQKQQGDYFAFVEYKDLSGNISYKVASLP